jgi:hypothetical protein
MDTKLTLKLDKEVINRANRYGQVQDKIAHWLNNLKTNKK